MTISITNSEPIKPIDTLVINLSEETYDYFNGFKYVVIKKNEKEVKIKSNDFWDILEGYK